MVALTLADLNCVIPKGRGKGQTYVSRFWSFVEKQTSGCWFWVGGIGHGSYGRMMVKGQGYKVHRISYLLEHGELPVNLHVCHRCDAPLCVNPGHLFLGTHADNMQDMVVKGRGAMGEKHGQAKLTTEKVKKIRNRWETGGVTQQQLSGIFDVRQPTISRIVNNKTWRLK